MYASDTSFRAGFNTCPESPISYDAALARLSVLAGTSVASQNHFGSEPCQSLPCGAQGLESTDKASVSLLDAVGRKSVKTVHAPYSTPRTDTSAMDGYVVNASSTAEASKANPLRLRVIGSIAAGDAPLGDFRYCAHSVKETYVCAEIMTGACFPHALPYLDSVVKIEDVSIEQGPLDLSTSSCSYIILTEPVKNFQHRRPAGSDFAEGDIIIERETIIQPKHVAALASLGFTDIEIAVDLTCARLFGTLTSTVPELKVGVLSTGSEIVSGLGKTYGKGRLNGASKQAIPDSNGPYIVSNLKASFRTVTTEYLGIMQDDEEVMVSRLRKSIFEDDFDIIITSGGVSKGRHDLVRHVVETRLNGRIVFHGAKIRPGAPILLASFDHVGEVRHQTGRCQTVFFGVPGNPLAAAVACRFFIIPYILGTIKADPGRMKQELRLSQRVEYHDGKLVSLQRKKHEKACDHVKPVRSKPINSTVFWLARLQSETFGSVVLVDDQASYKLRGLLEADCWVTVPTGLTAAHHGDLLLASPL